MVKTCADCGEEASREVKKDGAILYYLCDKCYKEELFQKWFEKNHCLSGYTCEDLRNAFYAGAEEYVGHN